MTENKLRTAVLGLNNTGQRMLEAASQLDYFKIEAVADKDTELADKTASEYKCRPYDDYRRLIIQNRFDCILIAAATHQCVEYIRAAIKKKCNILKLSPMGRNFEEAAELAQLAEDEKVKFAIANLDRFAESFLECRRFLQEGRIEQVSLITAFCNFGNEPHPTWQTDPKLAGGGVLLHNCYEVIDQIIWDFSVPQQVYSLNTNTAGDRQQRLYLTEDTAVVTMKFGDTLIGNLIASRRTGAGPEQQLLKVHGKEKTLIVSRNQLTVSDCFGQVKDQLRYEEDESASMTKLLDNFAVNILWPDKNTLCSTGAENLKNMAVIESAYLSARTAVPEEPSRILQMAQIEPTTIWPGYS